MISKTVDPTNFNFGRPLGLSMRGKKSGGVDDLSLVRFPLHAIVLFEGVFDQILLKTAKNDRFSHTFSSLRLSLPHILRTTGFFKLSTYLLFIELGLAKIWLVLVHSKQNYV